MDTHKELWRFFEINVCLFPSVLHYLITHTRTSLESCDRPTRSRAQYKERGVCPITSTIEESTTHKSPSLNLNKKKR